MRRWAVRVGLAVAWLTIAGASAAAVIITYQAAIAGNGGG